MAAEHETLLLFVLIFGLHSAVSLDLCLMLSYLLLVAVIVVRIVNECLSHS